MSKAGQTIILALEGVPETVRGAELGRPLVWAKNESEASERTSSDTADFLLVNGDVAWHHTFAQTFAPDHRPAVLVFGGDPLALSAIADEWVSPGAERKEIALRIGLARERARVRRQSVRRNFVDHLTGLPNRRAVVRALIRDADRVRRQGGSLSLALMDLDGFKRINDTYGHNAGDKLLRRVGVALGKVTRANELCGRVGGDEFAIVIGGFLADARRAADRALHALAQVGVSASSGVAEWEQGKQLRGLYRHADEALKANKDHKRSIIRTPGRGRRTWNARVPWRQAELFQHSPEQEVPTG